MTVGEIMTHNVLTVRMDDTVGDAKRLFDSHNFHHLLVIDRTRVVGIVSDRDILRAISPFAGKDLERELDAGTLRKRIHLIMTRHPLTTTENASVQEAARSMLAHGVSCLPVLDRESRPIGIVSWKDILRVLVSQCEGTLVDGAPELVGEENRTSTK